MRKYVRMGLAVGGWISVYLVFFRSIFFAPMIALLGAEIGIIVSFIAIYFWCMSFYLILHRDNGRSLHQNIAKLLAVAEGSFLSRMARRLAKRDSLGLLNAMKTQLDKYVLAGILLSFVWPCPPLGVAEVWVAYPRKNPGRWGLAKPLTLIFVGCLLNTLVWAGLLVAAPIEMLRGLLGGG